MVYIETDAFCVASEAIYLLLSHFVCLCADTPGLTVSFVYNNAPQKLLVKLPLTINKFFEPTEMNAESFFARWKNLGR